MIYLFYCDVYQYLYIVWHKEVEIFFDFEKNVFVIKGEYEDQTKLPKCIFDFRIIIDKLVKIRIR